MKTLAEHDAEKMALYLQLQQMSQAHANGIACPKCGEELWDTNPMVMLSSNPPRKQIHCVACGYVGTRIE